MTGELERPCGTRWRGHRVSCLETVEDACSIACVRPEWMRPRAQGCPDAVDESFLHLCEAFSSFEALEARNRTPSYMLRAAGALETDGKYLWKPLVPFLAVPAGYKQ